MIRRGLIVMQVGYMPTRWSVCKMEWLIWLFALQQLRRSETELEALSVLSALNQTHDCSISCKDISPIGANCSACFIWPRMQ